MTGKSHQTKGVSSFVAPSTPFSLRDSAFYTSRRNHGDRGAKSMLSMSLHHEFVSISTQTPFSNFANLPTLISEAPLDTNMAQQVIAPNTSFEPVMPDTSLLVGFGAVAVLCVVAANVWANEVVPVSRTKLAISKSRGEVREYLDDLKEGSVSLESSEEETAAIKGKGSDSQMIKPNVGDGRDFERWLFSDWLNNDNGSGKPGRQKEPALPVLKKAKWNSGDNPVLVTAAIMMLGVVIASVTERVSSLSGTI